MFDNLPGLASVFALGFLHLVGSITLGRALSLHPVAIVIVASLAYAAGVAIVVLPGERIRDWLQRKLGKRATVNPESLVGQAWARFGLPGLALLAPMTTGAQIGALIGLGFNAKPLPLLLWLTAGGILWAIILSIAISAGLLAVTGQG